MEETEINNMPKKQINHSLNVLKCIAIFAVICIHCNFYSNGLLGTSIDSLARFAVPLFFLISGFYSFYNNNNITQKKYKTRIIRLLYLLIISNIMYFVFFWITKYNFEIIHYLTSILTIKNIFKYIILNTSPTAEPLWFIQSLLYCYLIFYIFSKYDLLKYMNKIYIYIPILLLGSIMLGEMSYFIHLKISVEIYRNFFFMGLPFFICGYYINEYGHIIKKIFANKIILYSIIPCCFLVILETLTTGKSDIYIGTILFTILIFIWAVNNPDKLNIPIFEWIGRKLYAYMYIMHFIIIKYFKSMLHLGYLNSVIYFIISTIISTIIYIIIDY